MVAAFFNKGNFDRCLNLSTTPPPPAAGGFTVAGGVGGLGKDVPSTFQNPAISFNPSGQFRLAGGGGGGATNTAEGTGTHGGGDGGEQNATEGHAGLDGTGSGGGGSGGDPSATPAAPGGGGPGGSGIIILKYKSTNQKSRHIFLSSTSFEIPKGYDTAEYLVVAGGGGGGRGGGGGGAGGARIGTGFSVTGGDTIAITVGAGGVGSLASPISYGSNGANSVFSTISSTGGGGGAGYDSTPISPGGGGNNGQGGGSGGGASKYSPGDVYSFDTLIHSAANAGLHTRYTMIVYTKKVDKV